MVCLHAMQADFLCLLTGVKVMFRVALVLFKSVLGNSQHLAECPGMYEVLDKLRHIPPQYMEQEFLVREVCTSQSGHERKLTPTPEAMLCVWMVSWLSNVNVIRLIYFSVCKNNCF